ncbi:MAG: WYL domain-containing protein [Candidatus Cloacimonetes bacterium]|nr:WYL domain-containing protein [Candidatus Cloacimonadota bacterium]
MRNQALYRQWQMLHLINQHRLSGISKGELATHFGVSKKTIARDITNLSSCGFPIYEDQDIDRANQVFYYFTEGYRLPDYTLNYEDILSLSLASKLWEESGLVTADSIKGILTKIETKLDKSILKFYRDVQKALISDGTGTLSDSDSVAEKLSLVLKAILNYKMISFDYYSVQNQRHSHKEVSPLAIKYFNHNFYLAGYYKKIDQVIVFAINRMNKLKLSDKPQHEVDFDSRTYFESGFGIYTGEVFPVKLQFFPPTADYIAERIWHPEQKLTLLEDKSIILEMPANSLSEMKKFVLSYGAKVKVLEPEELREETSKEIMSLYEMYNLDKRKES